MIAKKKRKNDEVTKIKRRKQYCLLGNQTNTKNDICKTPQITN